MQNGDSSVKSDDDQTRFGHAETMNCGVCRAGQLRSV